jgi:hypothetical protein
METRNEIVIGDLKQENCNGIKRKEFLGMLLKLP